MLLTLSGSNEISRLVLPEKVSGKYSVEYNYSGNDSETVLMVEADSGKWKLLCGSNAEIVINGSPVKEYKVEGDYLCISVYLKRTGELVSLAVEQMSKQNMTFKKLIINKDSSFIIGTDGHSDLCINDRSDKGYMVQIEYNAAKGFSVSNFSANGGVYKNFRKMEFGFLKAGDLLLIGSFRFVFGKGFIAYDRFENVKVNSPVFTEFMPQKPEKEIEYFFDEEYEHSLFFCSPRLKKELIPETVSIEYPPQSNMNGTPMAFTLGPSITMGLSSAVTAGFTVTNQLSNGGSITAVIPSVIMASSMLLSSILWPVVTKTFEKHQKKSGEKKRKVKYIKYLRDKEQIIDKIIELQKSVINENNPSLESLVERVNTRDRALWERMYGQSDFLNISVGTGSVQSLLTISGQNDKFSLDEDILRKETDKLLLKNTKIENVPVELSLIDCPIVGIIGERSRILNFMKSWLIQLTTLYSYNDLGLIIIYDKAEKSFWECCRWFPHVWSSSGDVRLIASNSDEIKAMGSVIEEIRTGENERRYVIISASRKLALKADFIGRIIKDIEGSVFSIVALYDSMNYLPKECSRVIDLFSNDKANIYALNTENATIDELSITNTSGLELENVAVSLSNIRLANNSETFVLPGSYTFLEMLGVSRIEHINCLQRWSDNDPVESLKAPIGIDSHGDLCMLDLHQKNHGPHGLIAGMTGSGKSEFIMTMILSMAVNYHPDELAFILIDYKGGGMANAFKDLPHTAGIITNLDGAAITRSLVSIESELKRRQRIFGETEEMLQTSNLDIYKYQKLYRTGRVSEPLPHLIIVSDEFAELKVQQPEFMDQLISAARIGRSLGVHLILATQKPSGVVSDQIWSNSKFKICLKVQENADSMEMIKRPDAASLVEVGRFYLQVGYNEYFELGQSAWCGATYDPEANVSKKDNASIKVVDQIGRTITQADDAVFSSKKKSVDEKKQLDAIVEYIADLGKEENLHTRPLWLDPIPDVIIVDELIEKYGFIQPKDKLCFVIGECDIPKNQEQSLLTYDLESTGNIALFGASGTGKTTFLTTTIYNLACSYSPEQISLYIFDFNAQTMQMFKGLNHVGEVILPDDGEKIKRFFNWLLKEMHSRRKVLADANGDYYKYISCGNKMPWIYVMIHNFGAFLETYPDYEETLIILSREGIKYGISFILTAITVNSIRLRILQNCKTQIAMQLNDDSYGAIFGSTRGMKPSSIKGRGLISNGELLEFQTAYATVPDDVPSVISGLIEKTGKEYGNICAYRIPILPNVLKYSDLRQFADTASSKYPIALDTADIEPYLFNFNSPVVYMVSQSEKSVLFIQGIAEMLCGYGYSVMAYDGKEKFMPDEAAKYSRYTDAKKFTEAVLALKESKFDRTFIIINNLGDYLNMLSGKERELFINYVKEAASDKLITFIYSDTQSGISAYSSEKWFLDILNNRTFLWYGSGLNDQYKFQISTRLRSSDVKEGFGYIVEAGEAVCVKFITSEVYRDE